MQLDEIHHHHINKRIERNSNVCAGVVYVVSDISYLSTELCRGDAELNTTNALGWNGDELPITTITRVVCCTTTCSTSSGFPYAKNAYIQ